MIGAATALAYRHAPEDHTSQSGVTPSTAVGAPGQKWSPSGARTMAACCPVLGSVAVHGSPSRHGRNKAHVPSRVTESLASMYPARSHREAMRRNTEVSGRTGRSQLAGGFTQYTNTS